MKNVVVLTGAGISQESGIDTFRDSNGLWENYRVEDVAWADSWQKNEEMVREFYNKRRKDVMEAKPNEAHLELVRLEKGFNVNVVTQNIDDLHERAGSSNVLHLHGEIRKARSVEMEDFVVPIQGWELKETDLDPLGKPLRPFVVWFGESVPMLDVAIDLCQKADILVVVGTSLKVYPAASLLYYVPSKCKKYLVDNKDVEADLRGFTFVKETASIGVKRVVDMIFEEFGA